MAKQVINIGTAPNAGDGDPLRTGFNKANLNFDELYATAESLTASLASLSASLEAMDLSAFVSTAAAQTFGAAARAQHAANAGSFVTLPFRLVAHDAWIEPATFVLPPLAWPFWLSEGLLVVDDPGNVERLSGTTASGLGAFATAAWGDPVATPYRQAVGISGQLQRGEILTLTLAEVVMGGPVYDAQPPRGLTLWLRGVWAA